MFARGVFVFLCIFVGRQECLSQDETVKKLLDLDWQCINICTAVSGGTADFSLSDQICTCTLDRVDDALREKLMNEAQEHDLNLVLNERFDRSFMKREVSSSPQPEEHFVGQRTPNRIVTNRSGPSMYHPSTTRRSTTRRTTPRAVTPRGRTVPRRNMDIQQRLDQIQKRINDRRRSRARNSAGPRLQLRAGFENSPQSNLLERLKEMQKERQEKRKIKTSTSSTADPSVAAPAPKPEVSTHMPPPILRASHTTGSATNGKTNEENQKHEVITQDPSLYKDDNKL